MPDGVPIMTAAYDMSEGRGGILHTLSSCHRTECQNPKEECHRCPRNVCLLDVYV